MASISIIIPCYNRPDTLRKTLEKCQQQTLPDTEIICVDDASTDDTPEVVTSFQQADSRFRLLRQPANGGPGLARNAGLQVASGEYVAFLDSDDWPEKEDFYERLYLTARKENAHIVKGEYFFPAYNATDAEFNQLLKKSKNFFCKNYCAAIYKRSFLEKGSISFPALRVLEDPIFSLKAAVVANKLLIEPAVRLCITQSGAEDRNSTPEGVRAVANGLQHYIKTLNSLPLTPDEYVFDVATHLNPFIANTLLSGLSCLEKEAIHSFYTLWPLLKEKDRLAEKLILDRQQLELLEGKILP